MRKRAAESALGTVKWSAPPHWDLKVNFTKDGGVEITQHYYGESGKKILSTAHFTTINEAIRALVHSAESERAMLVETRKIVEEFGRIHRELESLGRGSLEPGTEKWERREKLIGSLQVSLENLEKKKRALKKEAKDLLIPHTDQSGVLRQGALEMLIKGNWPAAQACIAKTRLRLRQDNEDIVKNVIPILRLREDALRAYRSNHVFYIGEALKILKSASGLPPDERAKAVGMAADRLGGLDYLHSEKVQSRLSTALQILKIKGNASFIDDALLESPKFLEETLSRLNATKTKPAQ
ncbi:MAG: hypothetical protein V1881_00680 [Candidatus Micrarchaeota archaeon]